MNLNGTDTGDSATWAQQQRQLLTIGIRTNPHQHVVYASLGELNDAISSGIAIILMADRNEDTEDRENKYLFVGYRFNQRITSLDWIAKYTQYS